VGDVDDAAREHDALRSVVELDFADLVTQLVNGEPCLRIAVISGRHWYKYAL
jgi:hypothetical protein